jgi:O-antigen ligase
MFRFNSDINELTTNRWTIWKLTLPRVLEHPWMGHGQGQFVKMMTEFKGRIMHPHNSLVQFLYEWGIVGTVSLAILVVRPLRRKLRSWQRSDRANLPAIGALTAICIHSLFDGALFDPFPIMVAVISFAILASAEFSKPGSSQLERLTIVPTLADG